MRSENSTTADWLWERRPMSRQLWCNNFDWTADIGVIQRCNGYGFLLESFAVLFFDRLDRNDTAEARVPRLPHFAHSSRADLREDFVRAESGADGL
jgi:hypothetical protein